MFNATPAPKDHMDYTKINIGVQYIFRPIAVANLR